MLSPIIDSIAGQFAGRVKVGKVNIFDNPDLATNYGITTIPRVLFFKGSDQPVNQVVGLTAESDLVKLVNRMLAS